MLRRSAFMTVACLFAATLFVYADPTSQPITQPADGNLIVNGDFETPKADDRYRLVVNDQLTGWKIERGDVDVVSTYWPAAYGDQSIDLNGMNRGVISQHVPTKPGQWYRLTFFYAGNPDENAPDKDRVADVQWGKKRLDTLHPALGTMKDMNWQKAEYVVQAAEEHTDLLFVGVNSGAWGVALDDVSLVPCDAPPTTQQTEKGK